MNESYSPSNFHYWKSKFGFTCPREARGNVEGYDSFKKRKTAKMVWMDLSAELK